MYVASDGALWFSIAVPSSELLVQLLAGAEPGPGVVPVSAPGNSQCVPAWTVPVQLPPAITSIATPALAVLNNTIYAVFLSSTGDNQLFIASRTPPSYVWVLNAIWGSLSSVSPTAASFSGKLFILFKSSTDESMFVLQSPDGSSWTSNQLPGAMTTSNSPSLVATATALFAVFCSSTDKSLWSIQSEDGVNWTLLQLPTSVQTTASPSAVVLDGIVYVFFANLSGTVSVVSSTDLQNWSSPEVFSELTLTSSEPPEPILIWTPT